MMASSTSERIGKEEVPSKFCGAAKYKIAVNKEWFNDENYKGIFNHSKIDSFYSVDYIICVTDVYVAHQSIRDLKRHCESSIHKKKLSSVRMQPAIDNFYSEKDSESEKLTQLAEFRFSGCILNTIFHFLQQITFKDIFS